MPKTRSNRPVYSAPALEKGLDILELLATEPEPLTQQRIAARLRRTASELFRMLDVLVRRGYASRRPDGAYEPTLRLFELAHRQPPVRQLSEAALPVMERVARAIGQSVHLAVHYDRRILVVGQVDSPEPMGFSVRLGSHYPFGADRGSAFVLTAFQPPPIRDLLIGEMLAHGRGRPTRRALLATLARVRRRGHFAGESPVIAGVTQLSFPLFGSAPGAIAALASPYLRRRDVKAGLADAKRLLAQAAREISAALGDRAADRR